VEFAEDPSMRSTWQIFFVPFTILEMFLLGLAPYAAEEDLLEKGREEPIAFMSGGVNQTEREILNERRKGYTLKLIFSSKKGEFLSNVIVKVFDQNNRNILLTVLNGPWLFIDLPVGIYKIEASFRADRKKISQIKIEQGKQKVLHLQWQLKDGLLKDP
jgi:hypothetical protein